MNRRPHDCRLAKVSVVVPIYNVERYLRECIDSILCQTLSDIEIILINDGSRDSCDQIIDEYAQKDSRVIPVHQQNAGYGAAVNRGIAMAKGDYVSIIESDDWIEPDMLEKLYENAVRHDADIAKSGFYEYDSRQPAGRRDKPWKKPYQDIMTAPEGAFSIREHPELLIHHPSIWSAIYKREFVRSIKLNESRDASYQDFPFYIECLCKAERISVVREFLVHYRQEQDQESSTKRRNWKLMLMAEQSIKARDVLHQYGLYEDFKEEIYYHTCICNWGFYQVIPFPFKRQYFNRLCDLFAPLKNDDSFTYRYFSEKDKTFIRHFIRGSFIRSFMNLKELRKFLYSVRIGRKRFFIQLLGIQITPEESSRARLVQIKIKPRNR